MSENTKITTYRDFWPFYVCEHSHPRNRKLHFYGTSLTIVFFVIALSSANLWWLLAMPFAGYAFAWCGHFLIEKNRPATFTYPLWSLISDYKMFFYMLLGKMDNEVKRCQIERRKKH